MNEDNYSRLIPVPRWGDYYPWPSEAGLRHLIFHAKTNGFDAVIRRCGRRTLIDERQFFIYMNRKGATNG